MENVVNLNRTTLTGAVGEHTPKCVLLEIVDVCSAGIDVASLDDPVYRLQVCAAINNHTCNVDTGLLYAADMTTPAATRAVRRIAAYVNPHVHWSVQSLRSAYAFLQNIHNYTPDECSTYGPATPEYPHNLNLCACVHLCTRWGITLSYSTTSTQLYGHVRNYSSTHNLISWMGTVDMPIAELRNLYIRTYTVCPRKCASVLDMTALNAAYNMYRQCRKNVLHKLNVSTSEEACTLSVLLYDVDISYSADPITELHNLKCTMGNVQGNGTSLGVAHNNVTTGDVWTCTTFNYYDPHMNAVHAHNPGLFKFSANFNPNYPQNFYTHSRLLEHYKGETFNDIMGVHIPTSINVYNELVSLSLCPNFYHGLHLGTGELRTFVYTTPVEECKYAELVCFGVRNIQMHIYTYTELHEMYTNNMTFNMPQWGVLSSRALHKLQYLCNIDTTEAKCTLLRTIANVSMHNDQSAVVIRKLHNVYSTANAELRGQIINAATCVLVAGMRMRGWCDGTPYPIRVALVDDPDLVNYNVTTALYELENAITALGTHGTLIRDFPLLKYNRGFHFCNNPEEGITLWARIVIVRAGDATANMNSCIRMSSNAICTTAHKMYTTLGLAEPFDITQLRYIS